MNTRIRLPSLTGTGNKFIMVNREGVDFYVIDAMIALIKADCFVAAIKLARGNAPRLTLEEAKDLADAIRDHIGDRTPNYTVEGEINLTKLF